jgi:RNA polymerase sigma-70 factor (ECF subfamily)
MNEGELIVRCREGDDRAFAALIEPHRDPMLRVCQRITANREDAEDALQEALMSSWQNLASFRGEARFGTWLHRIAANAALAVARRRVPAPVDPHDVVLTGIAGIGPFPGERMADIDWVHRAIAGLPHSFKVALVLRGFGEMSYAEIAEHQHIGVQTVKSRISRARSQLVDAHGENVA